MTTGEGLLLLFLGIMFGCSLEDAIGAYRERTEAMLEIAGIKEPDKEWWNTRLWNWLKRRTVKKKV